MTIQANFPAIKPSLLLDFANTKQLDSRITYTRASTASYYDGVTTAMAEQNLVPYSQQLDDASWSKTRVTVTANATTAPDGTSTAEAVFETAVTNTFNIAPATNSVISGQAHTLSIFVKANGRSYVAIYEPFLDVGKYFNVTAGGSGTVLGNLSNAPTSATITAVGNDWFRCTITATTSSTSLRLTVYASDNGTQISYAGDASKGLYLWGAQVEQRSAVTAYTATTTQAITNYIPKLQSAASGVARFDNNPTTGESLGLLIEESRTNLTTYSSQFDNATWNKVGATITADTIVSPDGTLNADGMYETAVTSEHQINNTNPTFSASTAYTLSVYAKPIGGRNCTLFWYTNSVNTVLTATFDITAGTIVTAATASGSAPPTSVSAAITAVGNGWYRVSITGTTTGTAGIGAIRIHAASGTSNSYAGDTSKGIFIWGAQLEAGAFATSYIPTVASQVTRAADAASMTGTNFSSWYRADEGTIFIDANGYQPQLVFSNANSGYNNYRSIYRASIQTNQPVNVYEANNGTAAVNTVNIGNTNGLTYKAAYGFKTNDFGGSVNAGTVATDTSGLPALAVDRMGIGVDYGISATTIGTGIYRKIAFYPLKVTSAQLQALTS